MPLLQENKSSWIRIVIFLLLSTAGYTAILYLTERSDAFQVVGSYLFLFLLYFLILNEKISKRQLMILIAGGITLRLLTIIAIPNLSDDYLRFLWDGNLMLQDIDPFSYKPSEIQNAAAVAYNKEMLELVLSKDFFTVYPPALQYIFYLAAFIAPSSLMGGVIIMKITITLAELATIFLLYRLLKVFNLDISKILIYCLNPLVIIELCGNLHFEALMIPFILLSILLIQKQKIFAGATSFGLAIAFKLLPLMLLPFFIRYLGLRQAIPFLIWTVIVFIFTFLPFDIVNSFTSIYTSSTLYFQYFEFNASIYYVLRWLGFQIYGFNVIQQLGPILSAVIAFMIFYMAFIKNYKKEKVFTAFLFAFGLYYFLSTTIHPWYLAPMVCFSVFSRYRWAIVWSALIPFTYLFYANNSFEEITFILYLEYLILFSYLVYEIFDIKNKWLTTRKDLPYLKQVLK